MKAADRSNLKRFGSWLSTPQVEYYYLSDPMIDDEATYQNWAQKGCQKKRVISID